MHSELPPSRVRSTAGSRRVLIVDDDVDSRELLTIVLESHGHETRAAASAEEALAIASEYQPDWGFIDVSLPGMNGHELASQLRVLPELAGCQLVAVTGYSGQEAKARSAAAGFDVHLTKPINIRDVLALVETSSEPTCAAN
jgi:CheY-like chemotaxis protein